MRALAAPSVFVSLCLGLGLGLVVPPTRARAAGFAIPEQSAAGTGLAAALVARPDDASAIFYNPAGLGYQNGISALANLSLVAVTQSMSVYGQGDPPGGSVYDAQPGLFPLPALYLALRLHDRVSLGFGAFASHGLTIDWQNPDDPRPFPGRYKVLRIGLTSFTLNPTLAIRALPWLSFGFGLDLVPASAELARALLFAQDEPDGHIALHGSAFGVGANFGVLVRLLDGRLNFGFSYRSAVNLHFGQMEASLNPPPGVAFSTSPFTRAQTDIGIPHTIAVGAAGKPAGWLTLSLDLIATLWGDTQNLTLQLSSEDGTQTQTSVIPRNWKHTYSVRLGAEVDFLRAFPSHLKRLWPKLRFGVGWDQTPVPSDTIDPSLPDSDRVLISAGLSLGLRGLGSIDIGYLEALLPPRDSTNPDLPPLTYHSGVHVFSVSLSLQTERRLSTRRPEYAGRLLERTGQ